MRMRTLGLAAALSAALVHDTNAFVRPKGAEAPLVSADRGPRSHRAIESRAVPVPGLPGWTAMWDRDTGVPAKLWGSTAPIAGAVANAAIAETAARAFLAQHLNVLAPGAKVGDFELVSNVLSPKGDIRSVGFVQRANGLRVLGGSIGFSFKNDRLALVSSNALPNVSVSAPAQRLPKAAITDAAKRWLEVDGYSVTVGATSAEPIVMPIVRPRINAPDIAYRVVEQITVTANGSPGAWHVWIDAKDGKPIARKS